MSTSSRPAESQQQTYFQQQRAVLVADIAQVRSPLCIASFFLCFFTRLTKMNKQSMDSVLTNLNRLNRSLEAVIAVGNEFGGVEALWSTFETYMGNTQTGAGADADSGRQAGSEGDEEASEGAVDADKET
jgi:DASH complex subunit DAD1